MSSLGELQVLIQEKYGIDAASLGPDASMRDRGMDSLALAEFLFAIEDHFGITLPDNDPNIDTLGQLAVIVDEARAAQPKPQPATP
ncbi:MAG: acyl carrier protein [Variovorax sp.]|nr:MAG: acyl carrier protein [Variovorax sp.]